MAEPILGDRASAAQTIVNGGLLPGAASQYEAIYNSYAAANRQTVLTFQVGGCSQQILREPEGAKSSQQFLEMEMEMQGPTRGLILRESDAAQTTCFGNQVTLHSLQMEEMLSAVQLIEALAGGWDHGQLPSPSQVSARVPAAAYRM